MRLQTEYRPCPAARRGAQRSTERSPEGGRFRHASRHREEYRMTVERISRRGILKAGAGLAGALALPTIVPGRGMAAGGTQTVNMQLGWIPTGQQLGEVVAKRLGYFEAEKINLAIQPGGPSIDGIAIVASGRYELGQYSSSPSLMLAASQGIPVTCFA